MPEDDRFSKCMGKGYKGGYLHARRGHSDVAVARAVGRGISHHMRCGGFVFTALRPILATLERSLADLQNRRGELFHPADDVQLSFHQELDRLAVKHGAGTSTRALCDVARQTFGRLQQLDTTESAHVRAAFCDRLTHTLLDHFCFAVPVDGVTARQEIMRRNQRDVPAQLESEAHVAALLCPVVEGLVKQALHSSDGKPRRTPPLPKLPPRFSFAEMDQPLEGADAP